MTGKTVAEIPSPHGSGSHSPTAVVIHAMGEFVRDRGRDRFAPDFLASRRLSAHAFATPSGVIIQTLRDLDRGQHARDHNTGSLGLEFLVPGVHNLQSLYDAMESSYLSDAQYSAGVEHVRGWLELYSISKIVRHSDIDTRKRDPGDGFPWEQFLRDVGWCSHV